MKLYVIYDVDKDAYMKLDEDVANITLYETQATVFNAEQIHQCTKFLEDDIIPPDNKIYWMCCCFKEQYRGRHKQDLWVVPVTVDNNNYRYIAFMTSESFCLSELIE